VELGEVIASSRVLIALWSGDYLTSDWCRQELWLMLQSERQIGARRPGKKFGLVIPIIAHDGYDDDLPAPLASAQRLRVDDYFNSRMPSDGVKAEKLADLIALHAKGIAAAIAAAPRWDKQWPRKASAQLLKAFKVKQRAQRTLPRFHRR
jgi:hypothetical protein